ncbi:MAG: PH domain-containing protein [Candidatus Pacebacteria bacterium]|nr:PH domain-containing protein [Candidatus Paceibacterota bacterium]
MNSGNIVDVLEPGEEIVWQGVISRTPLVFSLIGFLLPILVIGGFFITQESVGLLPCNSSRLGVNEYCVQHAPTLYVSGAMLGLVVIGIGLILLLLNYLKQFVQRYTITSKRVIIRLGLIRMNYKFIYYNQIKRVLKKSGWVGRIFGFGTIKIDTGRMNFFHSTWSTRETSIQWDYLTYIDRSDEVYQYIHTAVVKAKETPVS